MHKPFRQFDGPAVFQSDSRAVSSAVRVCGLLRRAGNGIWRCSLWRHNMIASLVVACLAITGCALQKPQKPQAHERPECTPAAADSALVGNWLSVREQQGLAGKLYTQIVLQADGSMQYIEQLKRGKQPPQMLVETGCWSLTGQVLLLQTLKSNSIDVELDDPIYRNKYQITGQSHQQLKLDGPQGTLSARRMADSYKLSVF